MRLPLFPNITSRTSIARLYLFTHSDFPFETLPAVTYSSRGQIKEVSAVHHHKNTTNKCRFSTMRILVGRVECFTRTCALSGLAILYIPLLLSMQYMYACMHTHTHIVMSINTLSRHSRTTHTLTVNLGVQLSKEQIATREEHSTKLAHSFLFLWNSVFSYTFSATVFFAHSLMCSLEFLWRKCVEGVTRLCDVGVSLHPLFMYILYIVYVVQ